MPKRYPINLKTKPIRFWSQNDELAFQKWVERIPCIAPYNGTPSWEEIRVTARPKNSELHDLIGLFIRYEIPLSQLAQFVDKRNEVYFRTPVRDWYEAMFVGDGPRQPGMFAGMGVPDVFFDPLPEEELPA